MGIASELISDDNITSSSNWGAGSEPWMARLKVGPDAKGWCAALFDTAPYLQIDVGRVVFVTQIAIAGKSGQGMVKTFTLASSEEGSFWRTYNTDSAAKVMKI